ncbi:MAG: sugar-specific transcriptional regulator TrmB [Patiriisocius sp.]|jgi:sugar-specific transcriptional regulator TrmB
MNNIEKVKSALRRLDLSNNEQTVYLSLLSEGATTARVLSLRTGITRPSVYDQLKTLRELNLVVELEVENKAHFAAADIKHLNALLEDKIDRLEQSRDFLEEALPSLRDSFSSIDPKIRFFEGEEGVKQLLKDIMWHSNSTLHIYWPQLQMGELFDRAFLEWFDIRRAKRDLCIHSLWPHNTHATDRDLFVMLPKDVQKSLPKCAAPAMAYIIYDKKVACISSSAEAFGFIVESSEFVALQCMQFDTLWNLS